MFIWPKPPPGPKHSLNARKTPQGPQGLLAPLGLAWELLAPLGLIIGLRGTCHRNELGFGLGGFNASKREAIESYWSLLKGEGAGRVPFLFVFICVYLCLSVFI